MRALEQVQGLNGGNVPRTGEPVCTEIGAPVLKSYKGGSAGLLSPFKYIFGHCLQAKPFARRLVLRQVRMKRLFLSALRYELAAPGH